VSDRDTIPVERIRDRLAGQHLLVTGATGFLAKVFIEKLLRCVDTLGGIHLLVRPRSDGTSARQRVWQEVFGSSAFDRLRASQGAGFARLCEEKIHVVGGDLTKERLGVAEPAYRELTRRITLVVNSAATVTFDERIDWAVELNTLGPSRLLKFARDCGGVPMMQVSTCYVCGVRRGIVVEDFSAPERAREALPRDEESGAFDLDAIVEAMRGEATELRHRFAADQEVCRQQLIDAGMRWARDHGWNDTYTFTKWVGEQLLVRDHGDIPLVVFRPAIIESSFDEPAPGWIDGLRMADPIIVAYGRGKLGAFPGVADVAIDLIPVDLVANAMIATLPLGAERRDSVAVYQCGSSVRNPLLLETLRKALIRAYRQRPMNDDAGRPIHVRDLRLADQAAFVGEWRKKHGRVTLIQNLLRLLSAERRARKLGSVLRRIEQIIYFAKIYSPYTHLACRFSSDALQAAADRLHVDDRQAYSFDVGRIDWFDYIVHRHVPGLRSYVLGTGGEPARRLRAVADTDPLDAQSLSNVLSGGSLFDVFRRAAERYRGQPAFQIRRKSRWTRYTYSEALQATGAITRRFQERGLRPGDRVAICGENGPEWALTYLAAMGAGLTAAPLDPELPPSEIWASARFAGAKLMCAGQTTHDALAAARASDDGDVVLMREPFVPPPAAARDPMPDPVSVDESAVASILFTSGTTVSPKAVPLTHRNLLSNARALLQMHRVQSGDQLLSVLPLYHAFEFTAGFLVPLIGGATITYVDRMKGPEILSAMQTTGTTKMLVVPRLLRLFHDTIEQRVAEAGVIGRTVVRTFGALSDATGYRLGRFLFGAVHRRFGGHLRMFVCGGSRLDPELYDAFRRMGFQVYEGYGLTETAPVLTVNAPNRSRRGSVGPPLPGVELEVRRPDLEGVGEIWAKGPNVMAGYLKNPEATREVLVDGWFRTGDLGRVDPAGGLVLTGRSKDLIVTGAGKNVYPDEVEARYRDLPYVRDLCVFGMPAGDGLGDVVHAVAVIDEHAAPELDRSSVERAIRSAAVAIGESLPSHQRISQFHFWDRDLPKTSTLKAKRGVVCEIVRSEGHVGAARGSSAEATDAGGDPAFADAASRNPAALAAVRRILSRPARLPESSIHPHMHLHLDLGVDSIGRIDVLGAIEAQFDIRIDNETASHVSRVGDLLRVIGDKQPTGGAARGGDSWQRRLAREAASAPTNGHLPAPLVPVRWLVRGTMGVLMNSYVRIVARGRENIPATGGFILAPNHSSHLDSPSVVTAAGGKRRVWVAGAEDYFFNTRLKRLVFGKLLDTISFDRAADGVAGLRRCGAVLAKGDGLLLFPEGTRSLTGCLQPFKIGVAVLATEWGVPIVPVHIDRAYDLLRKGQRFVRPGTIRVTFGKPIAPPSRSANSDRYAGFQELTTRVESAVSELANEASA